MMQSEYDSRVFFACFYEYLSSKRTIMFTYSEESSRYIYAYSTLTKNSTRTMLCCQDSIHTQRQVSIVRPRLTYGDQRFMVSGWGESPAGDRMCFFVPGAQVVIHTAPIYFTMRYIDRRYCFCCKSPISQRTIMYAYIAESDRLCLAQVVCDIKMHTPDVYLTVQVASNRTGNIIFL